MNAALVNGDNFEVNAAGQAYLDLYHRWQCDETTIVAVTGNGILLLNSSQRLMALSQQGNPYNRLHIGWRIIDDTILEKLHEMRINQDLIKIDNCLNSRGFHGDYKAVLMRGDEVLVSKDLTLHPGEATEVSMNLP